MKILPSNVPKFPKLPQIPESPAMRRNRRILGEQRTVPQPTTTLAPRRRRHEEEDEEELQSMEKNEEDELNEVEVQRGENVVTTIYVLHGVITMYFTMNFLICVGVTTIMDLLS